MKLIFNVLEKSAEKRIEVDIDRLVIAGWTGRDRDAVMHHIRELAALGVPQPSAIPLFYRVAANQLTQSSLVEVVGNASSGEAEPLIFSYCGKLYVSLASDHTDRQLEAQSVALSKQLCAKPVARDAWPLREVIAHWDSLILRSWIVENGEYRLYQEGALSSLQPPMALLERYLASGVPTRVDGLAMSCGTMTAIGGIRPAAAFRMALVDEHLGRIISHSYSSVVLPVVA
ncbi:DUF2848 domain-containing protein [Lonsdalea quercina]|uniref:DUF2848 domain-containing protein n=1 Tax=Lonsdalea quercina TaxID=71657 RepID=UPI003976616E